jgi:hypothetical protein
MFLFYELAFLSLSRSTKKQTANHHPHLRRPVAQPDDGSRGSNEALDLAAESRASSGGDVGLEVFFYSGEKRGVEKNRFGKK